MKTEEGYWVCSNCNDKKMYLVYIKLSLPPINVYKCQECGHQEEEKTKTDFQHTDVAIYSILRYNPLIQPYADLLPC